MVDTDAPLQAGMAINIDNIIERVRSALGNCLVLVASAVFHQLYGDMKTHCTGHFVEPLHYVAAFILLEATMVAAALAFYIRKFTDRLDDYNSDHAI